MRKFLFFLSLVGLLQAQGITGSGDVLVNGVVVNKNTKIKYGDTIEVKANSKVKFNIGKDAFFAKSNTKFKLDTLGSKKILNVINGGVMAVFSKGNHGIVTTNMTAGIRGTGTYTFVEDGKTYFCTCYGHTEVGAHLKTKNLKATHHKMVWITKYKIKNTTEMQSHHDYELRSLEAMVGRVVPFDK
ncbi:hypothetical protein [Sulfurimonas sp.]|uniref:hypothetical protein n=1 Tax=Sulfurimonas sp. TaxID=2022749 RepID=UPI002B4864DA|nr:hypothetical protein [Sulfurimonas sp.]